MVLIVFLWCPRYLVSMVPHGIHGVYSASVVHGAHGALGVHGASVVRGASSIHVSYVGPQDVLRVNGIHGVYGVYGALGAHGPLVT